MPDTPTELILDVVTHTVSANSQNVPLKDRRWFYLYCLLALARKTRPNSGFVSLLEIRRLPGWEAPTPESIGKKISEHRSSSRLELIESGGPPTRGPYRISVPAQHCHFQPDANSIREVLLRPERRLCIRPNEAPQLFVFAEQMADAQAANRDYRTRSMHLKKAITAAVFPHQRALARIQLAAILVGQLRTEDVHQLHVAVKRELPQCGGFRTWIEARLQEQKALIIYNQSTRTHKQKLTETEIGKIRRHIQIGLSITGYDPHSVVTADLLSLLSQIEEEQGQLTAALRLVHRVLDYAIFSNNGEAIQDCYFRMAALHTAAGDRQREAGRQDRAKRRYTRAVSLIKQCLAVQDKAGLSNVAPEPELLLAHLQWHLGEKQQSLLAAEAALSRCGKHNQIRVYASRAKARVYWDAGRSYDAFQVLEQCRENVTEDEFRLLRPDWYDFFVKHRRLYRGV